MIGNILSPTHLLLVLAVALVVLGPSGYRRFDAGSARRSATSRARWRGPTSPTDDRPRVSE